MTLAEILATYRPESHGGTRGETWPEHARYLWAEDPLYMIRLWLHMRAHGGWFGPPVLVDGEVVQDRHHGIVVADVLGWHWREIPVEAT